MSNFELLGQDLFGAPIVPAARGPLAERFGVPPFTVIDAKQGEWQERKRAWLALGIKSEVGRNGLGDTAASAMSYFNQGKTIAGDAGSVFDPALCEIVYRWFCPPGGHVVDPFAGGSVRGIVAGFMGLEYWGSDLRPEQIAANQAQGAALRPPRVPHWVCGDSLDTLPKAPRADLVFSCPPYGDLEKYSEDPRDLSNMEYHTFIAAYKRIILRCASAMADNSFACFVVGDFRDKRGFYRGFVSDTIRSFIECGLPLYNDAVFLTPIGTAALRATRQFGAARKLVKGHQNILVFCKGDPRVATRKIEGEA